VVRASVPLVAVTAPCAVAAAWLMARLGFVQLAWWTLSTPLIGTASLWLHEAGHAVVASRWAAVRFEGDLSRVSTSHEALDPLRNAAIAVCGPGLPGLLGALWAATVDGPGRLGALVLMAHLAALLPPSRDFRNLQEAVRQHRRRGAADDLAR